MKKTRAYTLFNMLLVVLFVVSMLLQNYLHIIKNVSIGQFWLPCLLLLLAISLIFKAIMFNSDSTFWFSLIVIFAFAVVLFMFFTGLPYSKYWPIFIEVPAIASFICGLAFKHWFQIKLCIFLTCVFFPVILFTLGTVTVWWFLLIITLSMAGALYIISLLPEKFVIIKKGKKDE